MPKTNSAMFSSFKRQATPLLVSFALLGGGCATTEKPERKDCQGGASIDIFFASIGYIASSKECRDAQTSHTLMTKENSPVDNLLGFTLYLDQSPQAKLYLEERMGGKENIKIAPEIIVDLLTSSDQDSQSLGYQAYAYSPQKSRLEVSALLKSQNIDFSALTASIIANRSKTSENQQEDNYQAIARSWVKENEAKIKAIPATCAAGEKTQTFKTPSGALINFRCPDQ